MREDMEHVLNDVYSNGGDGSPKSLPYGDIPLEEYPKREGSHKMARRNWSGKERHLRYSVINSYLEHQVGRPWNDVWSDICRVHDSRSHNGHTIREAFKSDWRVERNPVEENGKVYSRPSYHSRYYSGELRDGDLYVGSDGILKKYVRKKEVEGINGYLLTDVTVVVDKAGIQYRKIDGIWYTVKIEKDTTNSRLIWSEKTFFEDNKIAIKGYFTTCNLGRKDVTRTYFNDYYNKAIFSNKRQIGKKEIRSLLKKVSICDGLEKE